uniref:Uncharacterized protein n=1 Tax=Lepeophtheirus salmonis TaxID=72036 RepID=A0A0K2TQH9_LEPSM
MVLRKPSIAIIISFGKPSKDIFEWIDKHAILEVLIKLCPQSTILFPLFILPSANFEGLSCLSIGPICFSLSKGEYSSIVMERRRPLKNAK